MFQSTDASELTQVKLCAASRGKQQAGCSGGVEAAVGRAAARGFDLLRMAGDVVKQPTEVPHQLAPRFARHGQSLENRRRIRTITRATACSQAVAANPPRIAVARKFRSTSSPLEVQRTDRASVDP